MSVSPRILVVVFIRAALPIFLPAVFAALSYVTHTVAWPLTRVTVLYPPLAADFPIAICVLSGALLGFLVALMLNVVAGRWSRLGARTPHCG